MTLFGHGDVRQVLPYDGDVRYHTDVFSVTESRAHLAALIDETPWESRNIVLFGREVAQPRLACWYGDRAYTYSGLTLEPREFTSRLRDLCGVAERFADRSFNTVLLNLYRDGRDSMGWHADDERELGSEPVIASLSFGAVRKFRFRHRESREVVNVDLEPGSVLVMRGLTQHRWMHDLPKTTRVTEPRVNLTFRHIA
ncbi:MAG: alpha-ketoglutarate-dependent dioxygenase AlkB family protein [Ilumatobacteraceae bacterium]